MNHGAFLLVGVLQHHVAGARVVVPASVCIAKSIGLSFHWRSGSKMRRQKRLSCSSMLTSSQSLIRHNARMDDFPFKTGDVLQKVLATASPSTKPITRSTPARLYQLR